MELQDGEMKKRKNQKQPKAKEHRTLWPSYLESAWRRVNGLLLGGNVGFLS